MCRAWRSSGSAFRRTWPRNSSFRTRWFQIWEETEDRGAGSAFKSRGTGLAVLLPEPQASFHLSSSLPRTQLSVLLALLLTSGDAGQVIHPLP